jgi:hypothetical protein
LAASFTTARNYREEHSAAETWTFQRAKDDEVAGEERKLGKKALQAAGGMSHLLDTLPGNTVILNS